MKRKWLIGFGILGALFLCWFMATLQSCGLIASPEPIPTFTATATRAPVTPTVVLPTPTKRPPTPTARPTSPSGVEVYQWRGVEIGTPADDVLRMWGKPLTSRKVGEDRHGLIVEWVYEDVVLTTVMWELDGILCARVWEMRLR